MVSKRKIAEAVLNRLNGGKVNRDSKITIRQAMFAVGEARNLVILQKLQQNKREFSEWDVPYDIVSQYVEKPIYDESKCEWYVAMPVKVLALHRGLGIYSVFQEGFESKSFIPQSLGSVSLYAGLGADNMEGRRSYYPLGDKLILLNADLDNKCTNIVLRLIVNSHDLGDREDFMLDGDMEAMVTDMAFQKLAAQVQLPSDDILNNTDKIQ